MFIKLALALALTVTTTFTAIPAQAISEEWRANSKAAHDNSGYMKSLYQGNYYNADQEAFRQCVMRRESTFTYSVIGGGGDNYHGAYQFHDADWRKGLTFMMAQESRKTDDALRIQARQLITIPINKWGRYWQDRAFFTALNYHSKWSGKHHWASGGYSC
jgi:hypothetical protein